MTSPSRLAQIDRTLRLKAAYLEALAQTGVISTAVRIAGISRQTVYLWIEADPDFAQRHTEAILESTERLEEEAFRRAVRGVAKPVYFKGREVGHVTEFSDALLQFLLRARKPETYRERIDVNSKVSAQVDVAPSEMVALVLEHLTDDDYQRAADAILSDPGPARAGDPGEPDRP